MTVQNLPDTKNGMESSFSFTEIHPKNDRFFKSLQSTEKNNC